MAIAKFSQVKTSLLNSIKKQVSKFIPLKCGLQPVYPKPSTVTTTFLTLKSERKILQKICRDRNTNILRK